jgi:hypothetical protein
VPDLHVICTCPEPDAYPFGCRCLNLDILSPEMHAIARNKPLIVNGQPRPYDREAMLAAWCRTQATRPAVAPRPTIRGAVSGAIGVAKAVARVGAADRATAESRYTVCMGCSQNDLGQCRVCGCFVAAKVRNQSEQCPSQKW